MLAVLGGCSDSGFGRGADPCQQIGQELGHRAPEHRGVHRAVAAVRSDVPGSRDSVTLFGGDDGQELGEAFLLLDQ
ncbi:MAG: hypothetical protein ACTH6A_03890 [Brachybacterium tyrofermentans]|uniref:hypothetical protein n=1 Tax=Brachybacterium tyrofermentans TaxID=47848 RepID=UPI003F8E1C1E